MEFASKSIELFQNQTKVFAKSLGYSRKNCNNGFQSLTIMYCSRPPCMCNSFFCVSVYIFFFYFVVPDDEPSDENSNCYRDNTSERIFPDQHKLDNNSPVECYLLCSDLGFLLYGVEFSNECFCGNDMPSEELLIEMSQCNMNCAGDSSIKCGGGCRMGVFMTGGRIKELPSSCRYICRYISED